MSFQLNSVEIEDTFAEGFGMWGTRIIITAKNQKWANIAAEKMTGFATSVIACDCEAGIEREIPPEETPDGRPGISVMVFGFSKNRLATPMLNRIGQCVLTCPTTAISYSMVFQRMKLTTCLMLVPASVFSGTVTK